MLGGLDMVVSQLDRALDAITFQHAEMAAMVAADDSQIDGRYVEVHQGVLSLLGRQPLFLDDLRLAAALLHSIRCVERMGDQCANIAKLAPLSDREVPKDLEILELIETMGISARQAVLQCRDAFRTRDTQMARDLVAGHRDQPHEPLDLPTRGRRRRRHRTARVGHVHGARRPLPRTHQRQHRRHRRTSKSS